LHDPNSQGVTIALTKGHRYAVKIEYLRGGFGTKLVWLPMSADPSFEAASAAPSLPIESSTCEFVGSIDSFDFDFAPY
jgi:hypothetical protein